MDPVLANGDVASCISSLSGKANKETKFKSVPKPLSSLATSRLKELEQIVESVSQYLKLDEGFNNNEVSNRINVLKENFELVDRGQPMVIKRDYRTANVKKLVSEEGYSVDEALNRLGVINEARSYYDVNGNLTVHHRFQLLTENGDRELERIQIGSDKREIEDSTLVLNDLITALKENKNLKLSIVINPLKINYLELLLKAVPKSISKRISIVPHEGDIYIWARWD